ncbi:Primase C terminal 2 (PriCT-2) [uncultured Paludibacter sp.]|nr:Primase C terminal 2 (PriCT-2) [uncultured Paludibacter sp.]
MSKKTFDPAKWQPTEPKKIESQISHNSAALSPSPSGEGSGGRSDIETITQRIEAASVDIAPNYADWRDLGFALADALGESGRNYYHRLSRFYPSYSQSETDKQYSACLASHGHGVTIKTLYHLTKSAGVSVSIPQPTKSPSLGGVGEVKPTKEETEDLEEMQETNLPTFPDEIYTDLPGLLQKVVAKSNSPEDRDLLLLGSLVVISACLPKVYGIYAEREVYPNLFLFVTAQASAGKGRLTLCRKLVDPIHKSLREVSKLEFEEYQRNLTEYAATKNKAETERPKEPPVKMLVIPANNSATGVFQILNDNNGSGLMFETEGDTLALTFKSEHGNYSDGFRKAFHHETISYNRRKDREFVEINNPRLSALLSGTPKQVSTLIPSAENGLFSRFIFYFMNIRPVWNDVFANSSDQTLDSYFNHLGMQFFELYKHLEYQSEPIRFCLTLAQQQAFNAYFSQTQNQYLCLYGADYLATVRRLGLITFRMAMILTTLRIMDDGNICSPLVCRDNDFNTALSMVKILVQHAAQVFQQLPSEAVATPPKNQKQQFLDELPKEFCRKDYLTIANKLGIPDKTAEKHIKRFAVNGLINHYAHDKYKKP